LFSNWLMSELNQTRRPKVTNFTCNVLVLDTTRSCGLIAHYMCHK
jgi:hypothetical protein